jgi:hypothetical protein
MEEGLRRRLSILFCLAILSSFVWSLPAAEAQQAPGNVPASLPSDVDLDAMLAGRKWNDLGATLSRPLPPDEITRKLNWLKTRMVNGAGFFVPLLYARDLWSIGSTLKEGDPNKDMRLSAAMISLYTYELIVIDGFKCEDRSAPGNRVTQLFKSRAAALTFLKQQPADVKSKIIDTAIALEQKTAPLRKDDDLVCRDGLDQMRTGLERGTQQEVPTPEGHFGRTIAVTPPVDYAPKFVTSDVYHPLQDKARADMRDRLSKLVGASP